MGTINRPAVQRRGARRRKRPPRGGFAWLLTAVLAACGGNNLKEERIAQPIAFNHKIHTVNEELGCDECHKYYETSTASGLPTIDDCSDCHTAGYAQSAEGKKVDAMADAATAVTWVRMYQLPSHVVFDHSAHTASAQIACETCHLKTGVVERPTRFRDFGNTGRWLDFPQRERTMRWCIGCHRERLASTDCLTCHE